MDPVRTPWLRVAVCSLCVLTAGGTGTAAAQENGHATTKQDSVTVIAGESYRAGPLKRTLLGSSYRDLWTSPITVPVLEPDTFAGGLRFLQLGGGRQTESVRLGTDDDREFVFRSVDKEQTGGLHPDLQETLFDYVIQDQISAKHPGANLVVASLMETAGVLHAEPTIAVMADTEVLGDYREQFAGMLGTIEARPTETEGAGRFGKYERLIGTERLLERLEESPADRADPAAFLAARLMDFLVGDWDRHEDQWRWAQTGDEKRVWLPIPRDRDNAFFDADGVMGLVGKSIRPYVVRFDETYPSLLGLTYNARNLDRRILPELTREEWDSVTMDLQARLTDEAIAEAMTRLPPIYYEMSAAELERKLRARRDALPSIARQFYAEVIRGADLYATDEPELAEVERRPDGSVRVSVATREGGEYLSRVFDPAETREIRLYLQGGADSVFVSGEGSGGIDVRVIGGGNDDHFEDQAGRRGGRTLFYDDPEDDDTFVTGPGTRVDTRPFILSEPDTLTRNNPPPPRDWGERWIAVSPDLDWRSEVGPVVGAGPRWTRYGFRSFPYATRFTVRAHVAPVDRRFGVTADLHTIRTSGHSEARFEATATQISVARFHGFGNETSASGDSDFYLLWANEFAFHARMIENLAPGLSAEFGPSVIHIDPETQPGSPAVVFSAPGSEAFTLGGLQGLAEYDRRDSSTFPTTGALVEVEADWFPLVDGGAPGGFVRSGVSAALYRPTPLPLQTVLALRGGGQTLWGRAPLQFSPTVGGGSSLRGYRTRRFTGDASLFGGAEIRSTLGSINLGVLKGDVGTIALAETGRVFVRGEDSDRWHTAAGGGLWFGAIDREYTGHLVLVKGERLKLTAGLGMPF